MKPMKRAVLGNFFYKIGRNELWERRSAAEKEREKREPETGD